MKNVMDPLLTSEKVNRNGYGKGREFHPRSRGRNEVTVITDCTCVHERADVLVIATVLTTQLLVLLSQDKQNNVNIIPQRL